jgi:pimeloyl-ACP methyl ester carboxylesterase
MENGIEPSWVDSPAGRVGVLQRGEGGLPVVFLHGLAGDRKHWWYQVQHLARRRRTIAIDVRAAMPCEIDGFADNLRVVMDRLNVFRAVLVGHRHGALVAIAFAAARPSCAAGLVLVDPPGHYGHPEMRSHVTVFLRELETRPAPDAIASLWDEYQLAAAAPETKVRVHSALRAADAEFVRRAYRHAIQFDACAALRALRCPIIAVLSDLNRAPFSLDQLVSSLIPRRIRGTSAWIQLDDPAELNAVLDEAMTWIESPRPLIA